MNTFVELYEFLQKYDNQSIIKWLDDEEDKWKGKDKQESLLRLFAGLHLIDKLKDFDICNGNFNLQTIKKQESYYEIFYKSDKTQKVLKDSGDSSDLTCIHKTNPNHILATTSKNMKNFTITMLDIDKILTNFSQYEKNGYELQICIVIPNIQLYKRMIKNIKSTSIQTQKSLNNAIILDWNDLQLAYLSFCQSYKNINIEQILNCDKKPLQLKLHQKLSVQKSLQLKTNGQKQILWGHIPRSGKTYIMSGCIIDDSYNKENCNYIVITTAPNETIQQYISVFNCLQLREFNIVNMNSDIKKCSFKNKNIVVCSKQFLQDKIKQSHQQNKILQTLQKIKFDIRFIDESHNGGSTEIAQKILDYYDNEAFTIQITATYSKPMFVFNIPKENHVLWDLEDISLCQQIHNHICYDKLLQKHGIEFENILLDNYNVDFVIEEYQKFPKLKMFTWNINKETTQQIIEKTQNNNYGWSLDACFLLNQIQQNKQDKHKKQEKKEIEYTFQNEEANLKLWYSIFGKTNDFEIPDDNYPKDNVFMNIIEKYCKNESRYIGKSKQPLIIMAFLPQNNIMGISIATRKLLETNNIIPEYEILCINSDITNDAKKLILETHQKTIVSKKKGLLVLSGKQCSLGVSLEYCDIVLLLNNNTSFDMLFQMMFRSMTESQNKKYGFVIDLNIQRSITTVIDYAMIINPKQHPKKTLQYIFEQKIVQLNPQQWSITGDDNYTQNKLQSFCDDVYDLYCSNTQQALGHLLNKINSKQFSFENKECQIFNQVFNFTSQKNSKQKIKKHLQKSDEQTKLGYEKKIIDNSDEDEETDTLSDDNSDEETNNYDFYIQMLQHIIPLLCILTIKHQESQFLQMFKILQQDENKMNIFMEQIKTWCGNNITSEKISKIINVYNRYMENNRDITQILTMVKELFNKNINNQNELSQLIDKYLIPHENEEKQNAEISTPYKLRQDMLNIMPKDFWEDLHTVFEPCCGKGGFLIDIVAKFMNGLKKKIKDEKKRYKTIVEELLYFSDKNPTNIYICKLLLDPNNVYKLNYNDGDTLELDINEKWKVNGFNAIIGNPPYQAQRKKENLTKGGGGDLLWNKFVVYSLDNLVKNGYLLYVHPSGWRKPEGLGVTTKSKYKGMYELMTKQNHMLYININDTQEGIKVFKCGTRFDYYLIQKTKSCGETLIVDENNIESLLDLKKIPFLPNKNIEMITNIISDDIEKNIKVLRPGGDSRREYISDIQNDEYKYTMIHSTPLNGVRYKYCNVKKESDHFDIPKIVFGESGINNNIVVDKKGEYGCTCCSYGFVVENNFDKIKKALLSEKFKTFIDSCMWSNYRIDWRLFTYLKKDFWKDFV